MFSPLSCLGALPFILCSLTTFAQTSCGITPATATVKFYIKNAGFTTEGSFKKFTGVFTFDKANPAACKLQATADASSLDTGIGLRDKHLKEADYFDTEKYPQITFASERFEKNGNQWQVVGTLKIKAVSQTVTLPLSVTEQEGKSIFKTQFTLNRVSYVVGKNHWTLSDDVRVEVTLICP